MTPTDACHGSDSEHHLIDEDLKLLTEFVIMLAIIHLVLLLNRLTRLLSVTSADTPCMWGFKALQSNHDLQKLFSQEVTPSSSVHL